MPFCRQPRAPHTWDVLSLMHRNCGKHLGYFIICSVFRWLKICLLYSLVALFSVGCLVKFSLKCHSCLFQVAGGVDIVKKTLDHFLPPTIKTALLLDLHAYDCWPAMTTLQDCLGRIRFRIMLRICNLYLNSVAIKSNSMNKALKTS